VQGVERRGACSAARRGAVRCGAVRCGAARRGAVRCGAVRCDDAECGSAAGVVLGRCRGWGGAELLGGNQCASASVEAYRSSCCPSQASCAPVSSTWASGSGGGGGTVATAASSCRARAASARSREAAAGSASSPPPPPPPPPPPTTTTRAAASSVRRLLCLCATPPPGMPEAGCHVRSCASRFPCRSSRYSWPRRSRASDGVSLTTPANQRLGPAEVR
jgi:hypothetical protein